MQYTTLPINVEALQFLDDADRLIEIQELADEDISVDYLDKNNPVLTGLASGIRIPLGDYIVKESNGELYHWEKELFELTHEAL